MKSSFNLLKDYTFYVWVSFLLIVFLLNILTINWIFLRGSIIDYKNVKSDEFDGTVYPIEYVPSPLLLTFDQRKQNYNKIESKYFIKIPKYNPEVFWKNLENLKPWTSEYWEVVTQRLIYTIPYMSTYKFDYKEYTWSHTWIDIIAPKWTPIKSIANWVVVESIYGSANFWNYVVIRHDNIPLPNWEFSNIYSLYGHMNEIYVKEWEKLKKWFVIWEVGSTWISTADHLHFQIDLESAPFKPYWPFSWSDMKKAWVDFFDAVNVWLWKENWIKYTINPLKFVNNNLDYVKPILVNKEVKEDKKEIIIDDKFDNVLASWVQEKENIQKDNNIKDLEVSINEDKNSQQNITKEDDFLQDFNSKDIETIKEDEKLLSSDKDFLLLNNIELALLWNNSIIAEDKVKDEKIYDSKILSNSKENQPEKIILKDNTHNINTNNVIKITNWFNIETKQNTYFKDINSDYKYFKQLDYFKKRDIINWFSDWSFRPKNSINRAEALKIITLAYKLKVSQNTKSSFLDVNSNTWQNIYINTALENKVIDNKNSNFYPQSNLTRVEAMKLLSKISNTNIEPYSSNNNQITDINPTDWKYKYMNYAFKNNFFNLVNWEIYPNKDISREEFIYILYKFLH